MNGTDHHSAPLPRTLLSRLPHPVVQAPMAGGGSTPALAAAVSGAGGLGFLAAGYQSPQTLREEIALTRTLTGAPFGVNVFTPTRPDPHAAQEAARYREELAGEADRYGAALPDVPAWDDDGYEEKLDVLAETAVPLVSFTFGCPDPDVVARLQSAGTEIAVTVTSPEEAVAALRAGADILVVQGPEAGGHRGSFEPLGIADTGPGLLELLPAVRKAVEEDGARMPLLAAGGVMDGAGMAAVMAAGASAAQLGTAFLATPESGAHPLHKAALTDPRWTEHGAFGSSTTVTTAFSGRAARALVNRFVAEHRAAAPTACYPLVHHLTAPLRRAAAEQGDPDGMALWAGTGHRGARPLPAARLVELLVTELATVNDTPPEHRAAH
ncbi:nitronate monooxygenase [Streptacidiphilus sp. ASG 303]|uniref:NAD(P)H-dependent flavin oxidoreductase n=1 Tax=Streptacidiphilus sp. ASG 303 TaxID=2896847 RepID=UPI0027E18F07|nr:nitronate monooxygenase [Streptacidiphilus sp. ASG 303]